ncbi:ABC transporter ATP-binding protein [Polymorphospora rubra]|uniref:Sugar ABC transporter ATP-binding protein n=1 Tax=Polymorphospora rubra TaxID=338584 RepID=A0A810MYH4_9ACTN|nr:ATP-binding cassette domain-containing protein [Polymorphospora rubra]BCJ66311.1 sugar ABC transporter ATP-binding protein [Polymorphospora rubra]
MIVAEELVKEFRRYERGPGLRGSLAGLFTRRHQIVRAVAGVSFRIPAGTKVAYVGANGAGKSTTIKLLTGIMRPTAGRCLVDGREPHRERRATAAVIGAVFGHRSQLWWDLPVGDSFRILRRIYDIPDPVYRRNMARFRELLDLDALGTTPVRQLSLGQRMRAEVAASLLHDPAVVFLDEPTIGLDLTLKEAVRTLINQVNAELGTTVMLTSHDIGDIGSICDQVLVVNEGAVVHQGSMADLLRTADTRTVVFDHGTDRPVAGALALLETGLPGVRAVPDGPGRIRVDFPVPRWSARQVMAFVLEHFDVTECFAPEPDLETVLRRVYATRATVASGGSG